MDYYTRKLIDFVVEEVESEEEFPVEDDFLDIEWDETLKES